MILGNYLIIGVSVIFLVGLMVTYALSVSAGHVKPLWCFISYTGNYPVESCIFSAVLNLCSGLYFLIVILRYSQLIDVLDHSEAYKPVSKRMKVKNNISLAVGLLGVFGLSMIGSFQQRNFHLMHLAGVFFSVCGTNLYFIFQTFFSFTFMSSLTVISVKIIRLVVVIFSSSIILTGAGVFLYYCVERPRWFHALSASATGRMDSLYRACTILEWMLYFLIQLFIYSLFPDFKKIAVCRNQIIFL